MNKVFDYEIDFYNWALHNAQLFKRMGMMESPYIVVVETKRGIDNQNPLFQLYGQLLAAAHLNWENENQEHSPQEIFGCYTIADSWTFVRAN
jgi:hypothetical protein